MRFLNLAVEAAKASKARQRHGCVVVKNGNILSVGFNIDINHPTKLSEEHVKSGASVHAEMRALSRVADPSNTVVYVARINKKGSLMYSRPCTRCEDQLDSYGIKRVVHT